MTTATVSRSPQRLALAFAKALVLGIALFIGACDEEPEVTTADDCDQYLDRAQWDAAIETCGQIEGDEGYSKTAQAYMGRAGIGLLALLDKIGSSDNEGLALLLSAFSVNPVQFQDVRTAIDLLLLIEQPDTTDAFNLIVSTDVAISTLIKGELDITVAANGSMVIPGITDSGLDQLSSSSAPTDIQDAMEAIYGAHYYATSPPIWNNSNPAILDLSNISTFVQANALGASLVELGELSDLDLSAQLDNGRCGLAPGAMVSGTNNAADGPYVAQFFPRRLNTSDATAAQLADDLHFVLLDGSGNVDNTREWKGTFQLASRLLNPDFLAVNCGAGVNVGNFTPCMGMGTKLSVNFTEVRFTLGGTQIQCGGGDCAALAASGFPVPSSNGGGDDEFGAEGATNMTHLAHVLHQLYPVNNNASSHVDNATPPRLVYCGQGDGWVHAREYDYYLRTLGQ